MAANFSITQVDAMPTPGHPGLEQLSFIGRRPDEGIDVWSPPAVSGGWTVQCQAGREHGREAIQYIRAFGDAALLSGIARAIAGRDVFSGVEVGFFAMISDEIARSA